MTKQITKHKSRRFRRFLKANEAVSALEYAILVAVVAGGIGIILATFGEYIGTALDTIGGRVATAPAASTPAIEE